MSLSSIFVSHSLIWDLVSICKGFSILFKASEDIKGAEVISESDKWMQAMDLNRKSLFKGHFSKRLLLSLQGDPPKAEPPPKRKGLHVFFGAGSRFLCGGCF